MNNKKLYHFLVYIFSLMNLKVLFNFTTLKRGFPSFWSPTFRMAILLLLFSMVKIQANDIQVKFPNENSISINYKERELFRLVDLDAEKFFPDVYMIYGFFSHKKKNISKIKLDILSKNEEIIIMQDGKTVGKIIYENTKSENLRFIVRINEDIKLSSIKLTFLCPTEDSFWGFGEQYNYIDFRGKTVPIWVQEQGSSLRSDNPGSPIMGRKTDTYFPMPYFMDPKKGKGFLLENTEYSKFDLCNEKKDSWSVEVWDTNEVSFIVFSGSKPIDIIRQLTAEVGRPSSIPPDWAFSGVWISAQGGTEEIVRRIQKALDSEIPVSAVWSQDWVGNKLDGMGNYTVNYRWIHDNSLYPNLPETIKSLREKGVHFLAYFNPFVLTQNEHFDIGEKKGYLIKDKNGKPYKFDMVAKESSLIDVFNPEAIKWFKNYALEATRLGISGWMADFGEWLPYDANVTGGNGRKFHNLYSTQWHRINREALEEAYPNGDFVIFTRSGFTYEHNVVQILWAGDQEADWNTIDGLPTVITAGLTSGIAGIPFFTHDIAGFSGGPSTKELFMRWTELGAFTPIMRTHDGIQRLRNHTFEIDEETLNHFTKFSKIHSALFPYIKELALEAVESGLPIIRHTMLVDSEWEEAYTAHQQWMIGNDMLFAPVVENGVDSVRVLFPSGEWEHLLTGEQFKGRTTQTINAPIGKPAVFIRQGKLGEIASRIRDLFVK